MVTMPRMEKAPMEALSPIEIEELLKRATVHLNPYQQKAFVTIASKMIQRFEVNRFRSTTPISFAEIIVQALNNFATAASEVARGNVQRALSSAADAANLLALRLTQEPDPNATKPQ